ncbi:Protein suppressor of hairy wing [Orchesella cincta]|uniref:Protein suppressor of hairy wing n=1 Tax=Orchesella cincta TaxID=48709 RepID=A0A1D2M3U1_ORCCI|nr:Protein suppressor of hairy wing [Orchesella cincta]
MECCIFCDKTFTQVSNLLVHIRPMFQKNGTTAACLRKDSELIWTSSTLKNHSNTKSFLCPFCGDGFNRSESLNYHIRRHIGENPHSRSSCLKDFGNAVRTPTASLWYVNLIHIYLNEQFKFPN